MAVVIKKAEGQTDERKNEIEKIQKIFYLAVL